MIDGQFIHVVQRISRLVCVRYAYQTYTRVCTQSYNARKQSPSLVESLERGSTSRSADGAALPFFSSTIADFCTSVTHTTTELGAETQSRPLIQSTSPIPNCGAGRRRRRICNDPRIRTKGLYWTEDCVRRCPHDIHQQPVRSSRASSCDT